MKFPEIPEEIPKRLNRIGGSKALGVQPQGVYFGRAMLPHKGSSHITGSIAGGLEAKRVEEEIEEG
jgi:hypothetical protein